MTSRAILPTGQRPSFRYRAARLSSAVVLALVANILVVVPATQVEAAAKKLDDINPDVSDNSSANATTGGRTNGIAMVPGDNQTYYIATEFGGIYKTTDGGDTWDYLEDHLPRITNDVQVDPGNTGNVFASSSFDGRTAPLSGINVSRDGGATWTHPPSATPGGFAPCPSTAARQSPAAFGISVRPDAPANIYIGTNCGLAISNNSGANWSFVDVAPGADASANSETIFDVVVQAGTTPLMPPIIDVCGDDGHFRSIDGGTIWTGGDLPTGRCNIAASPDETYVLLATVGGTAYETDNADVAGGASWTSLGVIDSTTQARIPFVRTNPRSGNALRDFDLWVGNVSLYQADCTTPAVPASGGALRCDSGGGASWNGPYTRTVGAHDDVGDIAFNVAAMVDACPTVFSSDGGMHQNTEDTSPGCHSPTWQKANVGLHATWLWGMAGTDLAGSEPERLFYGMQDNGMMATAKAGQDPKPDDWTQPSGIDVFDTESDPDRVLMTVCCFSPGRATKVNMGGPDASGLTEINTYPSSNEIVRFKFPSPIGRFGDDKWAMLMANATDGSGNDLANQSGGLYITNDIDDNPIVWNELGNAPNFACGVQTSVPASTPNTPTFFLTVGFQGGGFNPGGCNSINPDQVWRYSGTALNGTWDRVDDNALGFIANLAGGFTLFAVDPSDPNRMYASAPDTNGTPKMIFSFDGGNTWQQDTELDDLMNGNGDFRYARGDGNLQPTLLAFDPLDPNLIAAGGHDSGVFLSTNAGDSWTLLTDPRTPHLNPDGVPHIPQPRFAYFDHEPMEPTRLFIGTRGHGVWRLTPSSADLSISKSASPDPATAGDQLFYTITVHNDGPDDATDVVVTDDLPNEVEYITDTGGCVEDPPGSGNLRCELGTIAAMTSVSFDIKVKVKPNTVSNAGGPTTITNQAEVISGGATDPELSNNETTLTTIVEESADLRVTKVSNPDSAVAAGEQFEFKIFVDNLGPSHARNVVVTDNLTAVSPDFTVDSITPSQGSCSAFNTATNSFTCNLGLIPAEARATITVKITSDEGGTFADRAEATSDTPDPDSTNNVAFDSITVGAVADLELAKTDDPDPVTAGTTLEYTVTATNSGPSTAINVVISDVLPAGVTIVSVDGDPANPASEGSCNAGTPGDPFLPTTCTYGSVAPGATAVMEIVVKVHPDVIGIIHNDAEVTSDTFDPDNSDNLASEDTLVEAAADLAMSKSASPDPEVQGGRILTYELKVQNLGPSSAVGVRVEDLLPREVDFQKATISNGEGVCVMQEVPPPAGMEDQEPGEKVVCDLGTLDPNEPEPLFISIEVLVKPETDHVTVIHNTADIFSSTNDPVDGNNHPFVETTVIGVADLGILKTSDKDHYRPSETIKYTIMVTNNGPSDAVNVVVIDHLPITKQALYQFDTADCTKSGLTLTCSLGRIEKNTSKSFNVYLIVRGRKGEVSNTAEVSSETVDPNTSSPGSENSSTRVVLIKNI